MSPLFISQKKPPAFIGWWPLASAGVLITQIQGHQGKQQFPF